jgi:hypothetical protein
MSDVVIYLYGETPKRRCKTYGCLEQTHNMSGICDSSHFWHRECKVCQCGYTFRFTPGIDYTYCDDCRPKPNIIRRIINYIFY